VIPTSRQAVGVVLPLAGATVAAISLPQAMAYALIAGIDPLFGLYSAIVVTMVASVFGSAWRRR
jgi:SulP family sulfate permease